MSAAGPTAEHCAVAIVAAAREVGENPIAVAEGATPSRARSYAYHALRECFPAFNRVRTVAVLGAPDPRLAFHTVRVVKAQARWWSPDALARVVDQVRGVIRSPAEDERPFQLLATPSPPAEAGPASTAKPTASPREEFTTDVAPRPTPPRRAQDHWAEPERFTRRPRVSRDVTEEICGDPAPGRSALAQRRAEEAARRTADDASSSIRPLSLARSPEEPPHG